MTPTSETGATTKSRATEEARPSGFTLLEMLAVVLLLALFLGIGLPQMGASRSAVLRGEAREIATHLEFARQRSVMTGKPHRLFLGMEDGLFQIEWFVSESQSDPEFGEEETEPESFDLRGDSPLPLAPQLELLADYEPVPGRMGSAQWLRDGVYFEGIETDEGFIDDGEAMVVFLGDGSTDAAEIVLVDEDGRKIFLDVRPLDDVIRIYEGES